MRKRGAARTNPPIPQGTVEELFPGPEQPQVSTSPIRGVWNKLIASHLQRNTMKTASFPSLRVDAELRQAAESVLAEGETLTGLIETAVRETIQRRQVQAEFLARGLRSAKDGKRTGVYHLAAAVHGELQKRLDARRKKVLG